MATAFVLRTTKTKGPAVLTARITLKSLGVNLLVSTGIPVLIEKWNLPHEKTAFLNYKKSPEGQQIFPKLDKIQLAIDSVLDSGNPITKEEAKAIIDGIVYAEEREEAKRKAEEDRIAAELAKKMTLSKYIDSFIEQIQSGARQTEAGNNYAKSTIKSIKQAMTQWRMFEESEGRTFDFDDIDMDLYYRYTGYLKNKGYAINSVGKCVKELKAILYTAETEGHHHNNKWKDKKFKGTRIEVDSIFLTREDLDKIMAVPDEKLGPGHKIARDIFMVGVWTAQRVSDYNNISKDAIQTYVQRTIVDVPDPENPGKTKPEIQEREITYIDIRQQKTGARVSVPVSTECKAILEKYDYQLPHLEDQVINRYIKDIGEKAGLTEYVEIETTKGGDKKKEKFRKCDLIHTHTARRTGATLMYLSGMDIYDIIKITGHTSPVMLRKYIKADQLQVVNKIVNKYNYFD